MVVEGAVVMVENIVRYLSRGTAMRRDRPEPIRGRRTKCSGRYFTRSRIIITAYLPIFTLQRVEGRLFRPMAWTVAFALLGSLLFSMLIAPVLASFLFRRRVREWHNPAMVWITAATAACCAWPSDSAGSRGHGAGCRGAGSAC